MEESPSRIIEVKGDTWSITYDLSHLPRYTIMALHGKGTMKRGEQIIELTQTYMNQIMDDQGRLPPSILDIRNEAEPSLASLRVGQAVMKEVGGRSTLSVVLLDRDRRNLALMHTILASIAKLAPGDVFDIAYSMEEAIEKIDAYYARKANSSESS
jgi:hypothetical protein